MNISEIEKNIQNLVDTFDTHTFIYELLLSYGLPKASITRLKKGNLNLSQDENCIIWKNKLFFKKVLNDDLHLTISNLQKSVSHNERFIIVTDYQTILSFDTKTQETLDCSIKDIVTYFDFFLPWAGLEKTQHVNENPADVKAAERMAKLFDEIKKDNSDDSPEYIHGLNVFLSRLLFCYFAEDTAIFSDNQFINSLDSHTQSDGCDLDLYFDNLFKVLNTPPNSRVDFPKYFNSFPYVNGGLFANKCTIPKFSYRSRSAILNAGEQDWSGISPDIFGSMFQAVIGSEQRSNLGQHYTSVPNIMKVIKPLFLNDLYSQFENCGSDEKKLKALLKRIYQLKIFDPACGSGNFLIIAYKELRILEMKIFKQAGRAALSGVELTQFYGIEIDDFAGEIAKLALWLVEHQMNVLFLKEFGQTNPTLPLKEAGRIVQGNASRLNWELVCPIDDKDEIYILGNPPYLGSRRQNKQQKEDMDFVFNTFKKYRDLDYISIWFYKAAKYIKNNNCKCAFVTTNSICQGLQVGLLWENIFSLNIEINFAYTSFKWTNNAKRNAGVTVAIVGLSNVSNMTKTIFSNGIEQKVDVINAYLNNGGNTIVKRRATPLSDFKKMNFGNMPADGGFLVMSEEEKNILLSQNPESKKYIKLFLGAQEFIRGQIRYCLWIVDSEKDEALKNPEIKNRIDNVRLIREKSSRPKLAEIPHSFAQITSLPVKLQLIMPRVSSERREYVPCGFLDENTIIADSAQAISDPEPWLFGVLNSKMHMLWLKTVGGRLKTDFRYAKDMVYNTFPFPQISTQRKNEIIQSVFRILEEREVYSDKTLAQLYDPDKMPESLREAHHLNDVIIEKCYRNTPFKSDEERLTYLFKFYHKMIEEESRKN